MSALIKFGFDKEQIELIKSTLMAGKTPPTDTELALFGLICQKTGLDPFSKQIFAIQRYDNKTKSYKWTFQPSVDGLRAIADRTGQYAGSDEALFDEGLSYYEFMQSGRALPTICKVTVYKMVAGQRCPFVGSAPYAEFVQLYEGKPMGMWAKMPLTMLSKCAESQALRKAFTQCQTAEQIAAKEVIPIETLDAETVEQEDNDWRLAGANWALTKGLDPQIAHDISKVATSKQNLMERVQSVLDSDQKPSQQ